MYRAKSAALPPFPWSAIIFRFFVGDVDASAPDADTEGIARDLMPRVGVRRVAGMANAWSGGARTRRHSIERTRAARMKSAEIEKQNPTFVASATNLTV